MSLIFFKSSLIFTITTTYRLLYIALTNQSEYIIIEKSITYD